MNSVAELLYHEALLSELKEIVLQGRISYYIFFCTCHFRDQKALWASLGNSADMDIWREARWPMSDI